MDLLNPKGHKNTKKDKINHRQSLKNLSPRVSPISVKCYFTSCYQNLRDTSPPTCILPFYARNA